VATENVTVTRQNTIALTAGQQAAYQFLAVAGAGPGVFSWDLYNAGPADIWVRWDGQADAAQDDPASLCLASGVGYTGAIATRMTVVAAAAATLLLVVNDRS
jgi:hypothetical protein